MKNVQYDKNFNVYPDDESIETEAHREILAALIAARPSKMAASRQRMFSE